jgi:hypothetical protein
MDIYKLSKHEQAQHFKSFKQDLLEGVDCFTKDFDELKTELEEALVHINRVLENQ